MVGWRHYMKLVSLALSLLVALIGVLVLTGWALDITALKSIFPALVAMKANTASGMLVSGVALSLTAWRGARKAAADYHRNPGAGDGGAGRDDPVRVSGGLGPWG